MRVHRTKQVEKQEALGIVISDGARVDVTSRLAAFVWGPVPDDVDALLNDRDTLAAVA